MPLFSGSCDFPFLSLFPCLGNFLSKYLLRIYNFFLFFWKLSSIWDFFKLSFLFDSLTENRILVWKCLHLRLLMHFSIVLELQMCGSHVDVNSDLPERRTLDWSLDSRGIIVTATLGWGTVFLGSFSQRVSMVKLLSLSIFSPEQESSNEQSLQGSFCLSQLRLCHNCIVAWGSLTQPYFFPFSFHRCPICTICLVEIFKNSQERQYTHASCRDF